MARMTHTRPRPRAARRGVSIVESALVIPLLSLLVFAGFEFGTIVHVRQSMLHAARESARVLAVQGGTVAEAEQRAFELLPNPDLPYGVSFTNPHPDDLDRDVTATVTLPLGDGSIGSTFGMLGDTPELTVSVTMRSEQ